MPSTRRGSICTSTDPVNDPPGIPIGVGRNFHAFLAAAEAADERWLAWVQAVDDRILDEAPGPLRDKAALVSQETHLVWNRLWLHYCYGHPFTVNTPEQLLLWCRFQGRLLGLLDSPTLGWDRVQWSVDSEPCPIHPPSGRAIFPDWHVDRSLVIEVAAALATTVGHPEAWETALARFDICAVEEPQPLFSPNRYAHLVHLAWSHLRNVARERGSRFHPELTGAVDPDDAQHALDVIENWCLAISPPPVDSPAPKRQAPGTRKRPARAKHLKWKQWRDEGKSHAQIAQRHQDETGEEVTEKAVQKALKRLDPPA